MLQASLDSTSLARRRVGERQNLLAARHGALRLLLLRRIAVSRLLVPLHDSLLAVSVAPRCLDRGRASLADHHLTAARVRLRTVVRFARSVFQTECLSTCVACEGKEIELIAIGFLAMAA